MATPIGNLADITLRALDVLRRADVIACEDTRTTRKLLTRYDIATPTVAYHDQFSVFSYELKFNLPKDWRDFWWIPARF